ncbi:MAG: formylmethanofuran dehydrogenase [Desulfobacteraceae bacterium]|nr:MAG: formylmethanofuran dehydrogenase [Desulfobacteraceae bacterium]
MQKNDNKIQIPDDLKQCSAFHGHLCPGLVYGYIVAKESIRLLDLKRSMDEEVVAVCENDSCAVDGLQVMLGTTAGKGNLIIRDYGKNAYTVINRSGKKAYRFSRINTYSYNGRHKDEFADLERAVSAGTASEQEKARQRFLKAVDLFSKPFDEVFSTKPAEFQMPPYAPLAPSVACALCGEMTMQTKMVPKKNEADKLICFPCSNLQ